MPIVRPAREGIIWWFPTARGPTIAGGDSGGASLIKNGGRRHFFRCPRQVLESLFARKVVPYVRPMDLGLRNYEFADAPVAPLRDDINRYLGAFVPPSQFVGTFSRTPPNYQPLWIYGVRPNGDLLWYRKDSNAAAWQGPATVGNGWGTFRGFFIAAGGNRLYGFPVRHFAWPAPVESVAAGRSRASFPAGEGIVDGITSNDGQLLWYKNNGSDRGARSWQPAESRGPWVG